MKVFLLNFTPDPEETITLSARLCYSKSLVSELKDKLDVKDKKGFLGKILKKGHLSVLEHANFTFGVEGISRATSHQLVRHRLASYSQQSQRYVKFNGNLSFIIPPSIENDPTLKEEFVSTIKTIHELYQVALKKGIPAEDARYILPNAATTQIIISMNARELLHFFNLRLCLRAQWEIRELAKKMLRLAREKAPIIFDDAGPDCLRNRCSEGDGSCGKEREVREELRNLSP